MRGHAVLLALALTACSPRLHYFALPHNASVAAPGAEVPRELQPLIGAWTGTWITPGWGPGYDALLLIEHLEAGEATVLYAWGNHPAFDERGWYRQRAHLGRGPGLGWTRGDVAFTFELSPDRQSLAGAVRDGSGEDAFVTLKRVPFTPPAAAPPPSRRLPRLPAVPVVPAPAGLPAALAGLLGTWEGIWDSGVVGRLAISEINSAAAMVIYAWSDDPQGGFAADYTREVALVYAPERKLTWGAAPRFTFSLSPDGRLLRGEWEREGRVSAVLMRKISPVVAAE